MFEVGKVTWENASSTIGPQINAEGVHVWPFDAAFPIDIRFLVFSDQQGIRLNRHEFFELLYGYSGEATFQVQNREITMKGGDLFIIGSTLFHRPIHIGPSQLKAVAAFFLPELIYANRINDEEATEYLMPFLIQDSSFAHVVSAETRIPSQVVPWIEKIYQELPATSSHARLLVKTCLRMILVLLGGHYKDVLGAKQVFAQKKSDLERLRPLFEFVDQHSNERISLEDAISIVGMSKSYFMRFFKRVTGQSFITHLNHFRIARAMSLLAETDKSIADISQEVGFCDQSYFGIVFRKFVHISPIQYRQHQTTSKQSVRSSSTRSC